MNTDRSVHVYITVKSLRFELGRAMTARPARDRSIVMLSGSQRRRVGPLELGLDQQALVQSGHVFARVEHGDKRKDCELGGDDGQVCGVRELRSAEMHN